MLQMTSTRECFKVGKTPLNTGFRLANIVEAVAQEAHNAGLLRDSEQWLRGNANSAKAFPAIIEVLKRLKNRGLFPVRAHYGRIVQIANGVSKTVIILETWDDEKICLKTDTIQDITALERCEEYRDIQKDFVSHSVLAQTAAQVKEYDRLRYTDIGEYILPIFKYFKRYNVAVEPVCEFVGSLRECCKEAYGASGYADEVYSQVKYLCNNHGLRDVVHHDSNCGVWQGHVVILDYAL